MLEQAGLVFSGLSPDGRLVEFAELPRDVHPFFVGTQAHPEFLSRPTRPHPLFNGLVAAALERSRAARATGPAASDGRRRARDPRPGSCARGPSARGGARGRPGPRLHDVNEQWPVVGDPSYLRGVRVTLRTDQVRMPGGDLARRDVIEHPGAVAIVALDGDGQVLLIRHYRHPVGRLLWEIPAGLRDVAGEAARHRRTGAA